MMVAEPPLLTEVAPRNAPARSSSEKDGGGRSNIISTHAVGVPSCRSLELLLLLLFFLPFSMAHKVFTYLFHKDVTERSVQF